MDPQDAVLSDIRKKIERERNIASGAANLKKKTSNAAVIQKCNTSIREAQQNIEYLEETLNKLTLQRAQDGEADSMRRAAGVPGAQQAQLQHQQRLQHEPDVSRSQATGTAPAAGFNATTPVAQNRTTFTRLELAKYECPSLGHRIQSMLQQLEFRIQVEQQYLEANAKISRLYQQDGDRQSTSKAESGRMESAQKIALLKRALKRYQAMHVDIVEVTKDTEVLNTPTARKKTLSGTLDIGVTTIRDVDHVASPAFSRRPECFVALKIDGVDVARTKGSRNDRWTDEFSVSVDKGNELEVTVYDKSGSQFIPVGVTWFLISDIAEEIRKKKAEHESMGGWVSASKLQQAPVTHDMRFNVAAPRSADPDHAAVVPSGGSDHASDRSTDPIVSSAWYVLEPAGQILLTLGFTKTETSSKKDFVGGLGRHGAIRQRKQEVYEQHGHKFVQKQFYNVMCCALCGDFLRYTGYQCQDCKLLCHKKCYQKIVTKCISKSSSEIDPDEAKLNHRIPHRFEPASNRGTKWCCHCGYILPWSRKTVRKCTECGIMCHSQCIHLVPDFCGMSLEMANKILTTIKATPKGALPAALPAAAAAAAPAARHEAPIQRYPTMDPYAHAAKELPPVPPAAPVQRPFMDSTSSLSKVSTGGDTRYDQDSAFARNGSPSSPGRDDDDDEDDADLSYLDRTAIAVDAQAQAQQQQQHQLQFQHDSTIVEEKEEPIAGADAHNPFGAEPYTDPGQEYAIANPFAQQQERTSPATLAPSRPAQPAQPQLQQAPQAPQPQAQAAPAHKPVVPHQHPHHHHHHRQASADKKAPHRRRRKLGLDDFQFLAVLGAGNFGKVMLAESRHTSKLCAIKVLKKDFIIESDEIASTRSEKRVFLIANRERHPFLLNLHCCFQTENRVYFVMEYISGGDLMHHVQCERFTEERAQFYAAEILLGLKYLHDNGVIYRDLKLDNILLTTEGHIKLADYGLCKEGMWHGKSTSTFCGTPEFMAPEILNEQGYGRAVDWWAFGVLLYQMLCNRSPFNGEDEDDTFASIQNDEARYPVTMTRDAVYLLQGLLTKDPAARLGGSERDAQEIMDHSYFANVDFDDILHLRVQPPFVPEIRSARDLSNFDSEFTNETPRLTPVNSVLDAVQQEQFRGFSYTSGDEVV